MAIKETLGHKKYADLYFDAVNLCACVEAGIPIYIVAPPSGAKTTLIKFLERYYTGERFVYTLERVSPMRFLKIQDSMFQRDNLLLSEDFSTIGDSAESVFKMSVIISKLAYDKRYIDPYFASKKHPEGLNIQVNSCAFVCGMQPLWLQIYGDKEVFETLIMEKMLRYYRLPIAPITNIEPMEKVIKWLLRNVKRRYNYYPPKDSYQKFANFVKVQCGARGIEYAYAILPELAHYVRLRNYDEWLWQLAQRFNFEKDMLLRWFEPLKSKVTHEALWKAFSVLFFAMQYNSCTYDNLKDYIKVRARTESATRRYMRFLIRLGMEAGFVNVLKKRKLYIIPSKKLAKLTIHDFRMSLLKGKKQHD